MADQEFVAVSWLNDDDDYNVKVTTSDCVVTGLALVARKKPFAANTQTFSLPIRIDGTTRCKLEAGEWLFYALFRNDKPANAKVNLVVETASDPSTSPKVLPTLGKDPYVDGAYSFDVFV